jgi:uncharacterized OB-fold protein
MDSQICKNCSTVNHGYLRFCENCNADMLAVVEDEKSGMFQSSVLDDEPTPSKTIDNVLIGIVLMITLFAGGFLWFIVAAIIHFIFRQQEKSWLFFIVPWVLLQIFAFALWR